MQHERQEGQECLIAAISMLSGQPYEEVRESDASKDWVEKWWKLKHGLLPGGKSWTEMAERMFAEHGISTDLSFVGANEIYPRVDLLDGRKVRGRGILMLGWLHGGGHAVAFLDGVIYDPGLPKPYPLREWLDDHAYEIESWQRIR